MTTPNMNNESAAPQTPQTPPPSTPPKGATEKDNVALYLPSVMGYEKIARRAAEAVAEQMDFNADRIEDLKTAVAEACMNAIEHGNAFEREVNVAVHMTILPDKLEVRVADVGRQAVPDELPEPGSGDMRGWGFFFIQNLVDEMEIVKLPDGGNEIRMVIYLHRQSPKEAGDAASDDATPAAKAPVSAEKPAASAEPKAGAAAETKPDAAAAAPVPAQPDAAKPAPEKAPAADAAKPKTGDRTPEAADKPAAPKAPAAPTAKALAPVDDKSGAVKPVENKPAAVQPVKAQPSAVQPVTGTPRADAPKDAVPAADSDTPSEPDSSAPAPPEQKASAPPDDKTSSPES